MNAFHPTHLFVGNVSTQWYFQGIYRILIICVPVDLIETHISSICYAYIFLLIFLTSLHLFQNQRQSHKQAITELSEQLRDSRKELREMIKDAKLAEQAWKSERAKKDLEEGRMRESLQKRDKLIEVCLLSLSFSCLPDLQPYFKWLICVHCYCFLLFFLMPASAPGCREKRWHANRTASGHLQ